VGKSRGEQQRLYMLRIQQRSRAPLIAPLVSLPPLSPFGQAVNHTHASMSI
jgi:hypothetical protein